MAHELVATFAGLARGGDHVGSRATADRGEGARPLALRDLVDLRRDDGVGAVNRPQPFDELELLVFDASARVDEDHHAAEGGASLHEVFDVTRPGAALVAGALGVAVAGEVSEVKTGSISELAAVEDDAAGASWRARGAREALALADAVEQRRFADVRAAREGDFRERRRGEGAPRAGFGDEVRGQAVPRRRRRRRVTRS